MSERDKPEEAPLRQAPKAACVTNICVRVLERGRTNSVAGKRRRRRRFLLETFSRSRGANDDSVFDALYVYARDR